MYYLINSINQDDADLADILPVNSDSTDLFNIVEDGILLWYFYHYNL